MDNSNTDNLRSVLSIKLCHYKRATKENCIYTQMPVYLRIVNKDPVFTYRKNHTLNVPLLNPNNVCKYLSLRVTRNVSPKFRLIPKSFRKIQKVLKDSRHLKGNSRFRLWPFDTGYTDWPNVGQKHTPDTPSSPQM